MTLYHPSRRLQDHQRIERGDVLVAADVPSQVRRAAAGYDLECEAKHSIGKSSAIMASVVANSDGSSGVGGRIGVLIGVKIALTLPLPGSCARMHTKSARSRLASRSYSRN